MSTIVSLFMAVIVGPIILSIVIVLLAIVIIVMSLSGRFFWVICPALFSTLLVTIVIVINSLFSVCSILIVVLVMVVAFLSLPIFVRLVLTSLSIDLVPTARSFLISSHALAMMIIICTVVLLGRMIDVVVIVVTT